MARIRLSPSSLNHLRPIARVSAIAIGSIVPAYLGPLGAYTGVLVGNILGDVISDFLSGTSVSLLDKIEDALYNEFEKKFGPEGLGRIVLRALKDTLDELEHEYRIIKVGKVIGIFKDPEGVEWFNCVLEKMENAPDKTSEVFKGDIKAVDGKTILEFLFSIDCKINDDLKGFLRERFPSTFQKHVARIINTNSELRSVFYTAVLEILKEHERRFEIYFEGLRNLSEFNFPGVEKKLNELVDKILESPFVGREETLKRIESLLEKENGKVIITGPAGVGKSALMAHLFERISMRDDVVLVQYFFTTSKGRRDIGTALRFIIAKLYLSTLSKPIEGSILNMNNRTLADTLAGMLIKQPPKKVVILIDALDEANAKELSEVGYPFPQDLPKNVYLIISVRGDSNNIQIPGSSSMRDDWKKGAEIIQIENLGFGAVTSLVGEMLGVSDNELETLSRGIYEKTQGHPLYLHCLLEELKKKLDKRANINHIMRYIENLPEKFEEYIDEQLKNMKDILREYNFDPLLLYNLFALLAIIKEPLDIRMAEDILGVERRLLRDDLPHEVRRWFNIEKRGSSERWSFQHEAIREGVAILLKKDGYIEKVTKKLLAYCERSVKSKEPCKYCIKHYPEHLYEAEKYRELLSLIEDERFLNLQREVGSFPLLFRTLELGINVAVFIREWEELLRLAIIYNGLYSHSLLEDFLLLDYYKKHGIDLTLKTITWKSKRSLFPYTHTARSYLLLSSYLLHINNDKDAKEVIRLLDKRVFSSYALWEEKHLIGSLLELWQEFSFGIKRDLFLFLSLTGNLRYYEVTSFLLQRNLAREAKLVLDKYCKYLETKKRQGEDVSWDLIKIAEFFIQINESRRAKEIIKELKELIPHLNGHIFSIIDLLSKTGEIENAIKLAKGIWGKYDRSNAFKIIILNLIREGDVKRAMEMVENIEISAIYPDIISEICISLAKVNKIDESLLLLNKIIGYEYSHYHVKVLAEIIKRLIQENNEKRAREILKNAMKIAEKIKWDEERAEALEALVGSILYFKKVEEVVMLLDVVHQLSISISNSRIRSKILAKIAKGFIRKGLPERAQEVLGEISEESFKFWVMVEVGRVYLNNGDILGAVELLNEALSLIEKDVHRVCYETLIYEELANILAQIGDIKLIKNYKKVLTCRPGFFEYLGVLLLEFNRINIAFELSQWALLDERRHRKNILCDESFVLIELAKDLVIIEEFERAWNFMKKVNTISDYPLLAIFPLVLRISEGFAKYGDFEKATKVLESFLHEVTYIHSNRSIRSEDYIKGQISGYMIQIGNIETAIRLVEKIENKYLRLYYMEETLRGIFQSSPDNKSKTILKQFFEKFLKDNELDEAAVLLPYLLDVLPDMYIHQFFRLVISLEPAKFVQIVARFIYNMANPPENIINLLLDYVSSHCDAI